MMSEGDNENDTDVGGRVGGSGEMKKTRVQVNRG